MARTPVPVYAKISFYMMFVYIACVITCIVIIIRRRRGQKRIDTNYQRLDQQQPAQVYDQSLQVPNLQQVYIPINTALGSQQPIPQSPVQQATPISNLAPSEDLYVRSRLQPDEQLLWAHKPSISINAVRARIFLIMGFVFSTMGLIACIALVSVHLDYSDYAFAGLIITPFIMFTIFVGINGCMGQISNIYGLSNRRALVFTMVKNRCACCSPSGRNTTTSFDLCSLHQCNVVERDNGYGDILFTHPPLVNANVNYYNIPSLYSGGFYNIPQVQLINDLIQRLRQQGQQQQLQNAIIQTQQQQQRLGTVVGTPQLSGEQLLFSVSQQQQQQPSVQNVIPAPTSVMIH